MAVSFCGKRLILTRSSLLKTPRRNGYIVLVPEIGEDLLEKNPLLKEDGFLEYNRLTIEKCIAAIGKQSAEYTRGIGTIEENLEKIESPDVFEEVFKPLEELSIPLDTTWGLAKTLYFANQSLMPPKVYMNIHERAKNSRAMKWASRPIYEACKKAGQDRGENLTEEQKRIISKFVLEGKLNGMELRDDDVLKSVMFKITQKQMEYSQKLEVGIKQFSHLITEPTLMKDFPESFLKNTSMDPSQPQKGPWKIGLQAHIKDTFLEYCPDRGLRWKVWNADRQLGAAFNDRFVETSTTLEHMRDSRKRKAQDVGYKSFAHLSMETKMAGSLENVYSVLDALLERAWPAQLEELDDLKNFASERGFDDELQLWDVPYWSRKQRRTLYNLKEEELREYFPLPQVLSSLFQLIERLFEVKFYERKTADVWHQDVRLFDIVNSNESEPIASFYFDPYARENDKIRGDGNSGWMVGIRNRSSVTQSNPLAALVFNFQPPSQGKPSLLSFKDVQLLFSKVGHSLQHLLTKANYSEVAGFSNVEWDAVEISSNFLLNWLFEPKTLKEIATHYETGETLPKEIIGGLVKYRSHMAGFSLCNEVYLSRLDLELHSTDQFWKDVVNRLWKSHFAFPLDKKDAHPCHFSEIFSGDWGAAYYSHLWAKMVAADAYSAFQEITPGNEEQQTEIAKRYRDTFLASGGGCHPSEVFRRFRGRDPSPKALLKNLGLKPQAKIE